MAKKKKEKKRGGNMAGTGRMAKIKAKFTERKAAKEELKKLLAQKGVSTKMQKKVMGYTRSAADFKKIMEGINAGAEAEKYAKLSRSKKIAVVGAELQLAAKIAAEKLAAQKLYEEAQKKVAEEAAKKAEGSKAAEEAAKKAEEAAKASVESLTKAKEALLKPLVEKRIIGAGTYDKLMKDADINKIGEFFDKNAAGLSMKMQREGMKMDDIQNVQRNLYKIFPETPRVAEPLVYKARPNVPTEFIKPQQMAISTEILRNLIVGEGLAVKGEERKAIINNLKGLVNEEGKITIDELLSRGLIKKEYIRPVLEAEKFTSLMEKKENLGIRDLEDLRMLRRQFGGEYNFRKATEATMARKEEAIRKMDNLMKERQMLEANLIQYESMGIPLPERLKRKLDAEKKAGIKPIKVDWSKLSADEAVAKLKEMEQEGWKRRVEEQNLTNLEEMTIPQLRGEVEKRKQAIAKSVEEAAKIQKERFLGYEEMNYIPETAKNLLKNYQDLTKKSSTIDAEVRKTEEGLLESLKKYGLEEDEIVLLRERAEKGEPLALEKAGKIVNVQKKQLDDIIKIQDEARAEVNRLKAEKDSIERLKDSQNFGKLEKEQIALLNRATTSVDALSQNELKTVREALVKTGYYTEMSEKAKKVLKERAEEFEKENKKAEKEFLEKNG
jgi:uncharacterized protein YcgL (UPF0745 family)